MFRSRIAVFAALAVGFVFTVLAGSSSTAATPVVSTNGSGPYSTLYDGGTLIGPNGYAKAGALKDGTFMVSDSSGNLMRYSHNGKKLWEMGNETLVGSDIRAGYIQGLTNGNALIIGAACSFGCSHAPLVTEVRKPDGTVVVPKARPAHPDSPNPAEDRTTRGFESVVPLPNGGYWFATDDSFNFDDLHAVNYIHEGNPATKQEKNFWDISFGKVAPGSDRVSGLTKLTTGSGRGIQTSDLTNDQRTGDAALLADGTIAHVYQDTWDFQGVSSIESAGRLMMSLHKPNGTVTIQTFDDWTPSVSPTNPYPQWSGSNYANVVPFEDGRFAVTFRKKPLGGSGNNASSPPSLFVQYFTAAGVKDGGPVQLRGLDQALDSANVFAEPLPGGRMLVVHSSSSVPATEEAPYPAADRPRIIVVGPTGTIENEHFLTDPRTSPPQPGYKPTGLAVSGDRVAITLSSEFAYAQFDAAVQLFSFSEITDDPDPPVKVVPKVKVKAPKTVKRGKTLKLTVSVTATGVKPGGKVTVKVAGLKARKAKVNSNGKAVVKVKIPRKFKKGKKKVTITYGGDSKTRKKTKAIRIKVV